MSYGTNWWRETQPEALWPLYEDFRYFLAYSWDQLGLPEPTPVQYDIAWHLQHGPKREIIEAFRGVGKSWITSVFVCWLLMRDPYLNILVISASATRSDDFTTFTKRIIYDFPLLTHLKPNRKEGHRDSNVAFDVGPARAAHAPSVKSIGITGQLAGSRADIIVADDVEVPNNSATQSMRDKLSEQVKEFDAILKPLDTSRIVFLGTPQTEESIYNKLQERGYAAFVWPARYPNATEMKAIGHVLAEKIREERAAKGDACHGQPTDPKRFGVEDLIEREASYGRTGFQLQFMLNTSLSDAEKYPLKLSDLVVYPVDSERGPEKIMWASSPDLSMDDIPNVGFNGDRFYRPMGFATDDRTGGIRTRPWDGSVMIIDPAGRGADETGVCISHMLNGQIFVPVCTGLRGNGYDEEVMMAIVRLAKTYKVNEVCHEANFGDGMFGALLQPHLQKHYPCTLTELKHSKQKELRIIDTLEPVMNQHRLIIDPKVLKDDYESTKDMGTDKMQAYRLAFQMTRITKDRGSLRHDDRLDALAMSVAYWVEHMAADQEGNMNEADQIAAQEAYDQFIANATRQHGLSESHEATFI